jgi:hypothetical protein
MCVAERGFAERHPHCAVIGRRPLVELFRVLELFFDSMGVACGARCPCRTDCADRVQVRRRGRPVEVVRNSCSAVGKVLELLPHRCDQFLLTRTDGESSTDPFGIEAVVSGRTSVGG